MPGTADAATSVRTDQRLTPGQNTGCSSAIRSSYVAQPALVAVMGRILNHAGTHWVELDIHWYFSRYVSAGTSDELYRLSHRVPMRR